MGKAMELDLDAIYGAWRSYLLEHSQAEHFGMVFDPTRQSEFPYANLRLISRPTVGGDLEGDEMSISLTFEAEAYINDNKYLTTLYGIDTASADFFLQLGFRRVGDATPIKVSNTVTKITSRYYMNNYCGYFLKELGSF